MKIILGRLERLLTALYDAYNRHSSADATVLYLPEGRHVEIAQGSERRGRQAIRKGLERFFEAFPDARWEELAFRRACSA